DSEELVCGQCSLHALGDPELVSRLEEAHDSTSDAVDGRHDLLSRLEFGGIDPLYAPQAVVGADDRSEDGGGWGDELLVLVIIRATPVPSQHLGGDPKSAAPQFGDDDIGIARFTKQSSDRSRPTGGVLQRRRPARPNVILADDPINRITGRLVIPAMQF